MSREDADGTARERARQAVDYQALFVSGPWSSIVLSPELEIVAVSDAFLRDTMTARGDIVGKNLFGVFPDNPDAPNPTDTVRAKLDRVRHQMATEKMAVISYSIKRTAADGGGFEERHWSPVATPIAGSGGGVDGILIQVMDITEYVRLAERQSEDQQLTEELRERTVQMEAEILTRSRELEEANTALRAASDAKTDFLSKISHELRTPLNAILGFGELLTLDGLSAVQAERVATMLGAAKHLNLLLDELVDISAIEASRLAMTAEAVPADDVIAAAVDLVRPLAASRGVHLGAAPATGRHLCADRKRLRQVLLNLLSNAIKYNHAAGTVSLAVDQRPGGRLRICVSDTGRGISPDDLGKLFVPFERLDAAEAGVEGTGLGLALSRQLIEAMGGTIGVTSAPGEGSAFWIELSASEPGAVADPAAAAREPIAVSRDGGGPKTVLYVEDIAENVRLVEEILKHRPFITVIPAMLAGVALDLARQHRPDLIILDLHLPDMPGEHVLRRLRADPSTRHIPVVVLSADATRQQIDRALAGGAADYLTKPIGVATLLRTVDRVLLDAGLPGMTGPSPAGRR